MDINKLKKEKEHLLNALDQDHQDNLGNLETEFQKRKESFGQAATADELAALENEHLTQIAELEDYFSAQKAEVYRKNTEKIKQLKLEQDKETSDLEQKNISLADEHERLKKVSRSHMSRRLRNFLSFILEMIVVIIILGGIAIWLIQTLNLSTHGFTASPSHLGTAAGQAIGKTLLLLKKGLLHLF